MDNRSDLELLAEYARTGTQNAFAELVFRHVDLVYTAARRQVRDPHLAQDVSQAVFLVLASKAGTIGAKVVLEGWLLNATRFAARDALRRRQRRQRHETEAAHQRSQEVQRGEPSSLSIAEQQEYVERLDAILDSALSRLGTTSRDALVLRFFHDKSFRDVGQELGIGEQAAKQRVCRGLRQLRKVLSKSGLQIPLEGLGVALGARGVLPAPPGLAHAIVAVGGKAVLAAGSSVSLAKGAMTLMAWTKAKIVAGTVAGLLLLSGGAVVVHHYAAANRVVVLNPGDPVPPLTTPQAIPTPVSWGFNPLRPPAIAYRGPAIIGTVVDPAGNPVANASVVVSSTSHAVNVYQTPALNTPPGAMTTSSSDGHFELMPTEQPSAVVVRGAAGYAAVIVDDPTKPMSITVAPWARVEGVVRHGSQTVPHARISIAQYGDQADWDRWHVSKEQQVQSDDNGHFVVDRVVPGRNSIGRVDAKLLMPQRRYSVDLPPGKTTVVNIGGDGRTLVGHLPAVAAAFSFGDGTVQLLQPKMPQPADWDTLSQDQKQKLQQAFWNTPQYKAWQQSADVAQFDVGHDGTFRVDDVPAGDYQINVQVGDSEGGSGFIESAGWGETPVTVPPVTPDQLDEPLDVGEVKVTLEKRIAIGDVVPEISADALDGTSTRLSDYRGKYVLLYLWASDRSDTLEKLDMLRAFSDRFGDEPVAIVGLNVDQSPQSAAKALLAQHVRWPQILVHGWDDPRLPRPYNLSPAELFLIDPQGRLLVKNADVPGAFGVLQGLLLAHSTSNVAFDHQVPEDHTPWNTESGEDNVARDASFSLVDGQLYQSSGSFDRLQDGILPSNSDAPSQCFFFDMGTVEGRFKVDLGSVIPIARVNTYSWHKSDRGPQVYKLYGATGDARGFDASPKIGTDPAACGWKQIAMVDTRPRSGPVGGRYTVHITDPSGTLGNYRYLLFEAYVTETADTWGHTFYGEVEVIRQPL